MKYVDVHCKSTKLLLVLLIFIISISVASAASLPAPRHIFVNVANDAGVQYDLDGPAYGGPSNTYYIKADGGGLNELHITNDAGIAAGQVTTSTSQSGAFYVSNTGGRGFDDDIILLLAVNGTIPNDFSIRIKSSGYNWTPATPGVYNPTPPTDYVYHTNVVDETFTKADFIYGPQTWKPGPGDLVTPSLALYFGQDISDTTNQFQLMFIDLKVGNILPSKYPGVTFTNDGAAKVEYSFNNLPTYAAFNAYGWCSAANQGQGISWTNQIAGVSASGYSVIGVAAPSPVPLPGYTSPPTDPDHDGIYEDLNANGRKDFNDVFIFFKQMSWISSNEPIALFDFNNNMRIDFNDIFLMFKEI